MGGFVDYRCRYCNLEIEEIPVGRGRNPSPYLALFRCVKCKTVGSTWIEAGTVPRCGTCYEPGVEILPDDVTRISCPKCGEPACFTPRVGSWE
jgi:hypothetical protein